MTTPTRATTAGRAYLDLRRKARQDRRPVDELMQLYVLECFLARLAETSHAERLVLKGGVLLAVFGERRPTRDVDLQAQAIDTSPAATLAVITEIAAGRGPPRFIRSLTAEADTPAGRIVHRHGRHGNAHRERPGQRQPSGRPAEKQDMRFRGTCSGRAQNSRQPRRIVKDVDRHHPEPGDKREPVQEQPPAVTRPGNAQGYARAEYRRGCRDHQRPEDPEHRCRGSSAYVGLRTSVVTHESISGRRNLE